MEVDNEETLRYCLEMGINPNDRILDGNAGLHIVVERGYKNLLAILLNQINIDINIRNTNGKTPLYIACAECQEEMVTELLEKGANVNIPDENGYTPLHKAVLWKYETIVNILLKHNPNVNAENIYGKTPLYIAAIDSPCIPILRMLIENGADVNLDNGKTLPLLIGMAICSKGKYTCIKINKFISECSLSCHRLQSLEIIELLLDNGANINICERYTKRTALHTVAITGYLPLAKILMNRGANKSLIDFKGYTPYTLAVKYKQVLIAALLSNNVIA